MSPEKGSKNRCVTLPNIPRRRVDVDDPTPTVTEEMILELLPTDGTPIPLTDLWSTVGGEIGAVMVALSGLWNRKVSRPGRHGWRRTSAGDRAVPLARFCEFCGALAGTPCVSASGRPSDHFHLERHVVGGAA